VFTYTPIFSDNFQRPNEEPLNPANWIAEAVGDLAVVSHLCVGDDTFGGGSELYIGSVLPNDQFSALTINQFGLASTLIARIRGAHGTSSGYAAALTANGDGSAALQLDIFAGASLAGPVIIPSVASGDVLEIGAIGTLIFVNYNGVQVLSAVDSTYVSGRPGAYMLFTATQTDTSISLFVTGSVALVLPSPPTKVLIPLPFSKRMTSAAAVFDCIFIASPQGAQVFAFGNASIIGPLQLEYAQLNVEYVLLRQQNTVSRQADLYAAIARALTTVQNLNTTLATITATGAAGIVLAGMRTVALNALMTLQKVTSDE
jgi:hypothetical protein